MGRNYLGSKTIRLTQKQRFIIKTCIEQYESFGGSLGMGWEDEIKKIIPKITKQG